MKKFVAALVVGLTLLSSSAFAQHVVGSLSFDHLDPASYPTIPLRPGELPTFMGLALEEPGKLTISNVGEGLAECFWISLFNKLRTPDGKFNILPDMSHTIETIPLSEAWNVLCFSREGTEVSISSQLN